MLDTVEENTKYRSPSGLLFKVLHLARHGQDCSWPMVVYTNLEPTKDAPTGTIWVIAESIFMRTFSKLPSTELKEEKPKRKGIKFKDHWQMALAGSTLIFFTILSIWLWNTNTYSDYQDRLVTFIDKSAPVSCHKSNCRANHTGLFRMEEDGYYFERSINLYMYSQMHLGEKFTLSLRDSDIRQTPSKNFWMVIRMFMYILVIFAWVLLTIGLICELWTYLSWPRKFRGEYSLPTWSWERDKEQTKIINEFLRRALLPWSDFLKSTELTASDPQFWVQLKTYTLRNLMKHPGINLLDHQSAVVSSVNTMHEQYLYEGTVNKG